MSIGSLSERVSFQRPEITPNGQGGFKINKNNPVPIGEYWAAVEVISNQEVKRYGGQQLTANIKIEARQNSMLKTNCQAIWQNNPLGIGLMEIEEITPAKNKPGYIWIYAREVVE
jgi:head-tail adaptor